jgi:DnaJ-class molecular chaperone
LEVDYYYLLGVPEDASFRDIKAAYRRMAEVYHPDKLRALPESVRKEGEEIMRLLNEAKTVLLNPMTRNVYDLRVGVTRVEKQNAIIVQEIPEDEGREHYVAIEMQPVRSKMSRVLATMKDVFGEDDEFQEKIAIAQEIVEATVIDEKRPKVSVLEDPQSSEEPEDVEMKLEFTVVDDKERGGSEKGGDDKKKRFKILAVEGEESEAVDVEWEEG